MSSKVGVVAFLLVLVFCTAGAIHALPLDPETADAPGGAATLGEMWARLLDWLNRTMGRDGLELLEMEGCHIDPNGNCLSY